MSSGYPARLTRRARLLLAVVIVAVVAGVFVALAVVDARSKPGRGGPDGCGPTGIDFACLPTGQDEPRPGGR